MSNLNDMKNFNDKSINNLNYKILSDENSSINNMSADDLLNEIDELKGAISNEHIWMDGSKNADQCYMHRNNILRLKENLDHATNVYNDKYKKD